MINNLLKLFYFFLILLHTYSSMAAYPLPWQIGLQDSASNLMVEINKFHNILLIITSLIVFFVIFLVLYVSFRFNAKRNPIPSNFSDNLPLEITWTIIPIIILIIISIPSFRLLRLAEEIPKIDMTIKVVGYQWFWTYSYSDYNNLEFDSNIIPDEDLKPGQIRLLEVDNRLFVPVGTNIRFLITAGDVLHSFAIPSLGIKMDAIPGRVNETWTNINNIGVYYGQCSELCGIGHGFMPIVVEAITKEEFNNWIEQEKTKSLKHSAAN